MAALQLSTVDPWTLLGNFLPNPTHDHPVSQCLSNVKRLWLAIDLYSQDHDGRFPLRDTWMDATLPFHNNDQILRCPVIARDERAPKNLYGYAFNQSLSASNMPAEAKTVPLLFDSVNLARNASGTLESLPTPGRHNGYNTVCFADGHVKPLKLEETNP